MNDISSIFLDIKIFGNFFIYQVFGKSTIIISTYSNPKSWWLSNKVSHSIFNGCCAFFISSWRKHTVIKWFNGIHEPGCSIIYSTNWFSTWIFRVSVAIFTIRFFRTFSTFTTTLFTIIIQDISTTIISISTINIVITCFCSICPWITTYSTSSCLSFAWVIIPVSPISIWNDILDWIFCCRLFILNLCDTFTSSSCKPLITKSFVLMFAISSTSCTLRMPTTFFS